LGAIIPDRYYHIELPSAKLGMPLDIGTWVRGLGLERYEPAFRDKIGGALAVLLAFALTACAPPPQPSAAADPAATAAATADPMPRFIGVIGTRVQHSPPFLGVPETNFYCLRSFIDLQTGETLHQLYVSDSYSGTERHWDAARDGAGHPLRFLEISRHEITCEGGCSYAEEFAADIPESELRANPQGLSVTFSARSGDEKTIVVSGSQITAQLVAVAARGQPVQPAAAQPPPSAHQ
jgi:hypothetical protein